MIHFFPRLDYRIQSKKHPKDICMILKSVTIPKRRGSASASGVEFVGEVGYFEFKIMPFTEYRNSFLPVITGRITTEGNISVIDIKMRLHLVVRILLAFWFGGVVYDLYEWIWGIVTDWTEESRLFLIVFFIFFFGLARFGFYSPAEKSIQRFKELFG